MRWKLTKVDSGQPAVPSNNSNNGSTMTMDVKSEPQKSAGSGNGGGGGGIPQHECAGCKKKITDRFMLKALELYWHEDCLKCACCDCRLGEVGSTLFTKANLILCKRDYLRLFGTTGYCSACSKMIPAFEMVMRARGNVYHLECFACQQCNHRFCVGDRFYLCDNKILCEYDYEERMVFANMPYTYNSIAHIKRQTQNLAPAVPPDDVSSGITKDLNDPQQQQQQPQPQQQQQQNGVASSLQGLPPAQHQLHQATPPPPKDRRSAGGREGGAG